MTQENLTAFFGWMAILNIAYLTLASLAVLVAQNWMSGLHQRLFGLSQGELKLAYFSWIGHYKIMALVFSIVPYLALRLI